MTPRVSLRKPSRLQALADQPSAQSPDLCVGARLLVPSCGGFLTCTGPKYQPPRRGATRQWELDRALVERGELARSPRFAYGVPQTDKVSSLRELRIRRSKAK